MVIEFDLEMWGELLCEMLWLCLYVFWCLGWYYVCVYVFDLYSDLVMVVSCIVVVFGIFDFVLCVENDM